MCVCPIIVHLHTRGVAPGLVFVYRVNNLFTAVVSFVISDLVKFSTGLEQGIV